MRVWDELVRLAAMGSVQCILVWYHQVITVRTICRLFNTCQEYVTLDSILVGPDVRLNLTFIFIAALDVRRLPFF